jgi:hypothetical protein
MPTRIAVPGGRVSLINNKGIFAHSLDSGLGVRRRKSSSSSSSSYSWSRARRRPRLFFAVMRAKQRYSRHLLFPFAHFPPWHTPDPAEEEDESRSCTRLGP